MQNGQRFPGGVLPEAAGSIIAVNHISPPDGFGVEGKVLTADFGGTHDASAASLSPAGENIRFCHPIINHMVRNEQVEGVGNGRVSN